MMGCMKVALFLSVVACAALVYADDDEEDMKKKFMEYYVTCTKETGKEYSGDDFALLMNKECPTSEDSKVVSVCLMEQSGLVKDGKFNEEAADALIENLKDEEKKEKAKQVMKTCKEEAKDAPEADITTKACNCMMKFKED